MNRVWREFFPVDPPARTTCALQLSYGNGVEIGGEGEKLAAAVFVSFDDLAFLDLLAGSRIMRPEGDPGRGGALIPISAGIVGAEQRYRWRRTLLPATPIRQVVLAHIDRRWLPHLVQ